MLCMQSLASQRTILMLLAGLLLGSCGAGEPSAPPEDRFAPLSGEEQAVHDEIVALINAAEALLQDGRLTRQQSDRIEAAIASTRTRLVEFMEKRRQGQMRGTVMMTLGGAGATVAGNDVTVVGVADDWLLVPIAIAALATHIITESPASRTALQDAWYEVGLSMRTLAGEIDEIGRMLNQSPAQAGLKPRPSAPPAQRSDPASTTRTTVDLSPPVPNIQPAPREEDRKRRDECIPRPDCPHWGMDTFHNKCADEVLLNEFPGCDVLVKNKLFDAKVGNTLYEVKTDDWDTYSGPLQEFALGKHIETAHHEYGIAQSCGYDFEFVVGDAELATVLAEAVKPLDVVRLKPRCNRKEYKRQLLEGGRQ